MLFVVKQENDMLVHLYLEMKWVIHFSYTPHPLSVQLTFPSLILFAMSCLLC